MRKHRRLLPSQLPNSDGDLTDTVLAVGISRDKFYKDFSCPICLEKLDKTCTIMACLHRFCYECLVRTLRSSSNTGPNSECPLCRAHVASKRASRPDHHFDILVDLFSNDIDNNSDNLLSITPQYYAEGMQAKCLSLHTKVAPKDESFNPTSYALAHQRNVQMMRLKARESQERLRLSGGRSSAAASPRGDAPGDVAGERGAPSQTAESTVLILLKPSDQSQHVRSPY